MPRSSTNSEIEDPLVPLRKERDCFDHVVGPVLEQMRRSESTTYHRPTTKPVAPFNGLWRQQIIEWMYTLVKHCKLRPEAAAGGAYFLDVAVAKGVVKTPNEYQLGAMTALYLGLKVFDSPSMRVVKLSSLIKLGNGEFAEEDIVQMEQDILRVLEWRLSPPTPNCFLQQYLVLLPTLSDSMKSEIEEKALQAIEVCVSKEHFFSMKPSVLGYAALLIALDQRLEEQKKFVPTPGKQCMEIMSLWQLRTFLYNMTRFAKLDHTSLPVSQTTIVLEQALKRLPLSEEQIQRASNAASSSSPTKEYKYGATRSASASPNNVAMQ